MPPFRHSFAVRFADVDHAGIVYYPRFYHYFHIAFEEFFRQRMGGRAYVQLLDERGVGFPAVKTEASYLAPLRFGDEVAVDMDIRRLGTKSITFGYRVWRLPDRGTDGDETLCAEGQVVVAVTDLREFKAIEVPGDLRQLFLELVARSG